MLPQGLAGQTSAGAPDHDHDHDDDYDDYDDLEEDLCRRQLFREMTIG